MSSMTSLFQYLRSTGDADPHLPAFRTPVLLLASSGTPSLLRFEGQPTKDDIVITTGSEIGGLLVDGLGDGVLVEAPQLPVTELNFLRTMSFGLLQVRILSKTHTSCSLYLAEEEESWLHWLMTASRLF